MALHRGFSPGIVVAPAGGGTVSEVSTTAFDSGTAQPTDAAVTVPAGSNRILIDLVGHTAVAITSWALDPASANQALTQFSGSPLDSETSDESVAAGFLLNAGITSVGTGSKVLRWNNSIARRCCRQVIFLSGAEQTTPASATNITSTGAVTVTLTGSFLEGTYLLGAAYVSGTTNHTVTGSVTEVAERVTVTDNDTFIVASASVGGGGVVNPTFTVTRDAGGNTRKAAFLIAVSPA